MIIKVNKMKTKIVYVQIKISIVDKMKQGTMDGSEAKVSKSKLKQAVNQDMGNLT